MINVENYEKLKTQLAGKVTLVAVSKTKPIEDIETLYTMGHRDFGENYVQELFSKHQTLPKDIHWHFIGHLQTNKVKQIISLVHLIHGVDSAKLLREINKQSEKMNTTTSVLLQYYIAEEETKFGLSDEEIEEIILLKNEFANVEIRGMMAMASFTENKIQIGKEFNKCKNKFEELKNIFPNFSILSMGMSSDYEIALANGSNMVRIGSTIFGERNYM